jgi:hypothetical protein
LAFFVIPGSSLEAGGARNPEIPLHALQVHFAWAPQAE